MSGVKRAFPVFSVIALLFVGLLAAACGNVNSGSPAAGAAATETSTAGVTASSVASAAARTITVSGVGIVTVVPDTANVQIGATATDASVSNALSDVDQRINALIKVLKDNGVADAAIQTSQFNIMVQYDPNSSTRTVAGYTVTHMLRFSVSPTDKVGQIIGAAVDAGANQIYDISFTTADPSTAEQQARSKAIDDALTRAQQFAEAAGAQVGQPLTITEGTSVTPIASKTTTVGTGGGVPVEAGTQDIEVDVTVTYELN